MLNISSKHFTLDNVMRGISYIDSWNPNPDQGKEETHTRNKTKCKTRSHDSGFRSQAKH